MLKAIARAVARPMISFLRKPNVRYAYLPKLREVISYDRKETMLHTCLEYVQGVNVTGDYVEFGVFKGRSMIAAYHLSRLFPGLSNMRFYGFDSFEGFPSLPQNEVESQAFPPGWLRCDLKELRRDLENANVDMNKVTLIPGWFADTLTDATKQRLPIHSAAVVNVDCDIFESTVLALDFIESYLVDGSIVIFDDWYCFGNRSEMGEQKAFREWLDRHRYLTATPYKEFGWDGKSFIINQLSSRPASRDHTATGQPDWRIDSTHRLPRL
jgi:O-methyltransferase